MKSPTLGSILLGSADPQRLRNWYCTAFNCTPNQFGFLDFGTTEVLIDGRADVEPVSRDPGRFILNFHVDDARSAAAHLDAMGASWLVPLEERRDGLFGTLIDLDGNYVQIIQLNEGYGS